MRFLSMPFQLGASMRLMYRVPAQVAPTYNCGDANVRCVSTTPGATQEYSTIQAAANAAQPGDVILVHPGSYAGFTINTSGTSNAPIKFIAQSAGVIINQGSTSEQDGIRLQNVSYVQVEGFTIRNDGSTTTRVARGISARGATVGSPMFGNVVRGNTVNTTDMEGVYLSQFAEGLVENNTIYNCGQNGDNKKHGLYLANAGTNYTVVRGNTIYNNVNAEANGIHCNGDLSVGGNGLIRFCTFENNIIYGNGQNGINGDGLQDSLIQNNLFYNNARNAVRIYLIDAAEGAARMKIINNTFIASNGWAVKMTEDLGGHVIFNNILIGSSGSLCVGNTSLSSNANVFGGSLSTNEESSTVALAAWRTATSQDATSVTGTSAATFVNAGAANYALSSSSPARGIGISSLASLNAPALDMVGITRLPTIDAGALEF